MNTLEIRLFGGIQVCLNGSSVGPFPTRWSAGVLAYLALNKGHAIHRDVLAAQFWPEETDQRARKGLRNALWRVRTRIEPIAIPSGAFLSVTGRTVRLNRDGVWIDVEEFDGRMALIRREVGDDLRLANLEECVRLYRGHFLEGHDYPWSTYERERLRLALLSTLEHLLEYHLTREDWAEAIRTGRAILVQDPLREHVHRWIMVCHHLMGDRPLAVRQYRECVRVLEQEMGLAPMEATQELYRDIMAETLREKLSGEVHRSLPSFRRREWRTRKVEDL